MTIKTDHTAKTSGTRWMRWTARGICALAVAFFLVIGVGDAIGAAFGVERDNDVPMLGLVISTVTMATMILGLFIARRWKRTPGVIILVATSCLSLACVFLVGACDTGLNLPGMLLSYVATTSLILAFIHTWRNARKFLILLSASLVGAPAFAVLHNIFYGLGKISGGIPVLSHLLEACHALFFLIAVFVCPPGFLIGVVGSVICGVIIYSKKKQRSDESS